MKYFDNDDTDSTRVKDSSDYIDEAIRQLNAYPEPIPNENRLQIEHLLEKGLESIENGQGLVNLKDYGSTASERYAIENEYDCL